MVVGRRSFAGIILNKSILSPGLDFIDDACSFSGLLTMNMSYRMPTPTNFQIVHDCETMHHLQALEQNAYHSHGTFQFALHQNIYIDIAFVAVSGL